MHNFDLLLTLAGGLAAALAFGYLTHRLGLSSIVGYLLGGIAVGPHTPGFVANQELVEQLAEVGVILLMFGVGLQFRLKELLAVRRVALPGAIIQSVVATALGAVVGRAFGWDWGAGIVMGLALSVASTVVLLRVLADHRDVHTPTGHIAVGWLIVEDILTVLMLVLLPVLFDRQRAGLSHLPLALGLATLKLLALVVFTMLVGDRLIPRLLERVSATRSRELFTLTVLVVALGIAVGSALLFGVSMALGAFLAGMVVGRSEFSLRAATDALPMRDAFAVLFFVSVGMLLDPGHLLAAPGLVAATLGVVLLGKPLAALGIVLLLGYPAQVALAVAVALAQIGEFSFILAALGKELGLLTEAATNTIVAVAIVSITLNPFLYGMVSPVAIWATRRRPLWRQPSTRAERHFPADGFEGADYTSPVSPHHRAVVIGYGPVGQTVTRLLRDNDIVPTIIELNRDVVRRLREARIAAVYGDASHRETLQSAGVDRAGSLILSAAGIHASAEIMRLARELNPEIRILARAVYVHELPALREAGAEHVFAGEGEIALAFTETILHALGATPDQIDRERARIHAELLGRPTRTDRQDTS